MRTLANIYLTHLRPDLDFVPEAHVKDGTIHQRRNVERLMAPMNYASSRRDGRPIQRNSGGGGKANGLAASKWAS